MQEYPEQEKILSQARRNNFSSFELTNRTIKTPLLLFYLELGLVYTKSYHCAEYTTMKSFSNFVQLAVDARRQGDENPNSSVAPETMNLLANRSYGYQTWITVAIQLQGTSMMKRHMERSAIKCLGDWGISMINFTR